MSQDESFEYGYRNGRRLSHFRVDVTSAGGENLLRALTIAFTDVIGVSYVPRLMAATHLLIEGSRFAVRTLALGGQSLTQQIAENQDCETEEAERIKLSERSGSLTADALALHATRLAQEITRSVLHFRRQGGLANPVRVWLGGGGAQLAGLGEALAEKLKVPVVRLDVLSAIEIAAGAARSDAAKDALSLADLVGAAATQLLPDQPVLNLLPPALRREARHRRRQP